MSRPHIEEIALASGVLQWTLAHAAKKNALAPEMLDWIALRCQSLQGESVILRGEDPAYFCAGFDLRRLQANSYDLPDAPLIAATSAMRQANACFIAALHGPAIGGGVELAVSCDLMIACDTTYLEIPAGKLAIIYHSDGIDRLRAVVGLAAATRMLLGGARIFATDPQIRPAFAEVVTPDQVAARALVLAQQIQQNRGTALVGNRRWLAQTQRACATELETHEAMRRAAYASPAHVQALASLQRPTTSS